MDAKSIGQAMEWFGNVRTVGVKFRTKDGNFNGKIYAYTCYQNINIKIGDLVVVPTRDTFSIAKVVVLYPGGIAIHRGIYGVINQERFNKNEEKFTEKVQSLAHLFECKERKDDDASWDEMMGSYID